MRAWRCNDNSNSNSSYITNDKVNHTRETLHLHYINNLIQWFGWHGRKTHDGFQHISKSRWNP